MWFENISIFLIIFRLFVSTFAILTTLSTAYDVYSEKFGWKQKKAFKAFSILFNYKELLKINKSDSVINCIDSIKVLSAYWIIMGHRRGCVYLPADTYHFFQSNISWIYIGHKNAVTTFFVCSAILVTQSFMRMMDRWENLRITYDHREFFKLVEILKHDKKLKIV